MMDQVNELKEELMIQFEERMGKFEREDHRPIIQYVENITPDLVNWLENGTTWILKVGVLSVVDSNKRDWGYLYIGQQDSPMHKASFIGKLFWHDGENDDPGRTLLRILSCAKNADILWDKE